jgi:hypothetical protein
MRRRGAPTEHVRSVMIPFCERVTAVPREGVNRVWTINFPDAREPKTVGEHLRKRRFALKLHQPEAAERLKVSEATLSAWKCDRTYPTWLFQPSTASIWDTIRSRIQHLELLEATNRQTWPFYPTKNT